MAKLRWGLIGGGRGSQIGPAHRISAGLDGAFELCAGALDYRPDEARAFGVELGLTADRAYGSWQEMLASEQVRDDKIELVTIATPSDTHFEIAKAFLQAGFHVLCEKPMTMTVEEGEEIVALAATQKRICAVNYGYSGYALVRHMKAMVARGDLGNIRLVVAEFAHGHHADAADADNPRVRWRYDPAQAGISAQFADCGIHAMHMASFVTGQEVTRLSADIVSTISSRELEDDAMVNFFAWMAVRWADYGHLLSLLADNMDLPCRFLAKKAGLDGHRNSQTSYTGCRLMNGCRLSNGVRQIYRQKQIAQAVLQLAMPKECRLPLPISILTLQDVSLLKNQASLCQTHSIPPQKTGFVQWRQYMPLPKVAPLMVSG